MAIMGRMKRMESSMDGLGRTATMKAAGLGLLLLIFVIPGCTTKIISHPAQDGDAKGIAYHLPATELSYLMTFRLTDCRGGIEITDTAIEQKIVPDRSLGAYLIDSSHFSNLSKTIPLAKISIANGLLTHISYDAKDNTAGIIKGGASLVGDVIGGVTSLNLSSLGGALTLLAGTRSIRHDPLLRSWQINSSAKKGEASGRNMCNRETKDVMDESGVLREHLKT
jgi:hypothetical protein